MFNEKSIRRKFSVILALALLLPFILQGNSAVIAVESDTYLKTECTATIDDEFDDNEIIIVIAPSYNFTEYTINDFSSIGCIEIKELTRNISANSLCRIIKLTLEEHSKANVIAAIDQLEQRGDIYSAEPNYLQTFNLAPNDPEYTTGDQWAIDKISLPSAWNLTTGSSTIRVGVIDSGIDASHPDLVNRVNTSLSRSFSPDFSSGTEDIHGHGTHVAGIIAAQGNNSVGIVGTCWNIELVSLRVATPDGKFYRDAVIEAIQYAEEKGIPILNYSGGSSENQSSDTAYAVAISNYSGLFVCSAGNESTDNDEIPHYPSSCDLANVIAVGNSTSTDTCAASSNYGQTSVDLFAPGASILSCYPSQLCIGGSCGASHHTNGYHSLTGTSMAAPYVAGVAALILSKHPTISISHLKPGIMNNCDLVSQLSGKCVTGGRLNAYKSVLNTHYYNSFTNKIPASHTAVCACGHTVVESHTWVLMNTGMYRCSKCSYISANTQIDSIPENKTE